MAKTKTRTQTKVIRVQQPAAQVIRVAAPRRRRTTAMVVAGPRKVVHHRRRSSAAGGSGGPLTPNRMLGLGLGGLIFGYIEKTWGDKIPTIPVIGRSGTIAALAYFASKQGGFGHAGIVKDVGMAAAVITGYSFGKTGKVSGDQVVGDDVVGFDQI
jgi:hypothetical protein